METVVSKYAPLLRLSPAALTATVKAAFQQSRDFADVFNLDPDKFEVASLDDRTDGVAQGANGAGPAGDVKLKVVDAPDKTPTERAVREDALPGRPESPRVASPSGPIESSPPMEPAVDASPASSEAVPPYLPLLMELSAHVLDRPDFNTVVTYLLEGLHRGCGFSRVALILTQHSARTLVARFGVGPGTDERLPAFTSPADPKANFLMQVMVERTPVRVNRQEAVKIPLPQALADLGGAQAAALGPLYNSDRTVGLIWADHARAIDDAMWNAFQLFILQANIALNRLAK
jgi:hypothetical protein